MKASGIRHAGREYALRILYSLDVMNRLDENPPPDVWQWWKPEDRLTLTRESALFANQLVQGILFQITVIDSQIREQAHNWSLERMSVVDRNLLRLSVGEMILFPDTPVKVILDETLELAKCYGDQDSSRFINGILDPLSRLIRQPSLSTGAESKSPSTEE